MQSRRNFIGKVATGLAGALATSNVLGANDRIRLGIIGPGDRGIGDSARRRWPARTSNASARPTSTPAAWKKSRQIAPDAKTYLDYRHLLDDKTIDAVLIATPQHLHAEHFIAALDAGKHVYQEKTMAFTVDHAKRMRAAYQTGRASAPCRSATSGLLLGPGDRRRQFPQAGTDGQDHRDPRAHVPQHAARQAAVVAPGLSGHDAGKHHLEVVPGRGARSATSTPTATSTGASSGITPAATSTRTCATSWPSGTRRMDLQIPQRGHHDRRHLSLEGRPRSARHHERLAWSSRKRSCSPGTPASATTSWASPKTCWAPTAPSRTRRSSIRYMPQKVNRPDGNEMVGVTRNDAATRTCRTSSTASAPASEPNCPFELGFRVSIACRMAVESYRQRRTVRWDAARKRSSKAPTRGIRVHAGTDPASQGRPRIRRSRDRAARHGVGRSADLPARSRPQTRASSATWARSSRRSSAAPGSGYIEYSIIIEELSRVDGSVGIIVAAHTSLCSNHIYQDGQRRAAAALSSEAGIGRMDRLLVADRAGSRVGRGGHAHHGRARRRLLGAQRREDVHHQRALRRCLRGHGGDRSRAPRSTASRRSSSRRARPGFAPARRKTSSGCAPAPPAK